MTVVYIYAGIGAVTAAVSTIVVWRNSEYNGDITLFDLIAIIFALAFWPNVWIGTIMHLFESADDIVLIKRKRKEE